MSRLSKLYYLSDINIETSSSRPNAPPSTRRETAQLGRRHHRHILHRKFEVPRTSSPFQPSHFSIFLSQYVVCLFPFLSSLLFSSQYPEHSFFLFPSISTKAHIFFCFLILFANTYIDLAPPGSYTTYPRTHISVGSCETFRNECSRLNDLFRADGVNVTFDVQPDAVHNFMAQTRTCCVHVPVPSRAAKARVLENVAKWVEDLAECVRSEESEVWPVVALAYVLQTPGRGSGFILVSILS